MCIRDRLGALQWRPDERRKLALESQTWRCPCCGPIAELVEGGADAGAEPAAARAAAGARGDRRGVARRARDHAVGARLPLAAAERRGGRRGLADWLLSLKMCYLFVWVVKGQSAECGHSILPNK